MHSLARTILPVIYFFTVSGQTLIDFRTQVKNVDFSSSISTRPFKSGLVLPPTCAVGEMFYKTDAPAGANLFGCVSDNAWVPETSGNSTLSVNRISPSSLVIGASCSPAFPCNIRFGNAVYSIVSSATATLSGGSGVVFIYVSESGTVTIGSPLSLSCSPNCHQQNGGTAFPPDSLPLYTWSASNGEWDASGSDLRAFLSAKNVEPGPGLIATEMNGKTVLTADPTLVGIRTSVPLTPEAVCTTGSWAVDASFLYFCVAPASWKRVALSVW